MKVCINTDGASRGNPGAAAAGAVIKDEKMQVLAEISELLGKATNNQAEYRAVIMALERARKLGARQVVLKSDSELVVRQLNGRYAVKNAGLLPLYAKAMQLIASFDSFSAVEVPRHMNVEADTLANLAFRRK